MSHLLPTFPGTANIWRFANWVSSFPPDVVTLCELVNRDPEIQLVSTPTGAVYFFQVALWFPAGTDVRGSVPAGSTDVVEFPAGSGILYLAIVVSDHAKGFPNEFRFAMCEPFVYPTPLP